VRDIQPEEIAPLVNLVNDLEEKSGGHESEYGSLGDITWSTKKYPSDDSLTVNIKFDSWTFWKGDQLQALMNRVNEFAENHDNQSSRIFYLEQDREVSISLEIPEEKTEGENPDGS
jgi:hypothetical protein